MKITLQDGVIYSWTALAVVIVSVACPPALALLLLFPAWHRRRTVGRPTRRQRVAESAARRRMRWVEKL